MPLLGALLSAPAVLTPRGDGPLSPLTAPSRSVAVVGSTLRLLNASANRHLFGSDAFPGGCVRCAVVGNGGILNGSRQGKAIDAHHLVFRCGGGPGWGGPGRRREASPGHASCAFPAGSTAP